MRQNPNQKVLSFMRPGLASDREDGRSGQACQSSDICVVRRVWPSDTECHWKATGAPPSFCSCKFIWDPGISFRVQSHIQIQFLGACFFPFLQKTFMSFLGYHLPLKGISCPNKSHYFLCPRGVDTHFLMALTRPYFFCAS